MEQTNWIEHRRGDGELIGWIRPDGDDFTSIDLLGRLVTGPTDWLTAEESLDAIGIGYLADAYHLRLPDGVSLRVRITEVSMGGITVKKDDFGDIGVTQLNYRLPFPAPEDLSPIR